MGRLEGAVALVSGGARGIGAAHVRALAGEGAQVVIGDVLVEEGAALAQELGAAAHFVALDVTSEDSWREAVAAAEALGPLTVLVNNAGIHDPVLLEDMSLERWQRTLDVNLTGTFLGIRSVVDAMRRAGGGSIVNTSSITAYMAVSSLAHYTATKYAVCGLTKAAALELGRYGIRVNSLHPGMIRTAMTATAPEAMASGWPVPRFGRPDEVARTMLFIVCDATYASGGEFPVDGGILAGIGHEG